MAYRSVLFMVEEAILADMTGESFSFSLLTSYGGHFPNPPFCQIKCSRATVEPAASGNFLIQCDFLMVGSTEPDNDNTYAQKVTAHETNLGVLTAYVRGLTPSDIQSNAPTATNPLTVHSAKLVGCTRDLNTGESTFEDTVSLEIYAHD